MKPTLDLWRAWLPAIERDLYLLHADRGKWREVVKIVKANPKIPNAGYAMDWITRMYVTHISSGIRRQMEESRHVVTMRRLLSSIQRNPTLLTRVAFVSTWCASDPADDFELMMASESFDDYARPGAAHVDPALVGSDIALLSSTGHRIKAFVDERIAHLNKAHANEADLARLTAPTFNELDEALSLLGTLLQKYYLLLTCKGLASAEPVLQYNWTECFTVPWLIIDDEPDW